MVSSPKLVVIAGLHAGSTISEVHHASSHDVNGGSVVRLRLGFSALIGCV